MEDDEEIDLGEYDHDKHIGALLATAVNAHERERFGRDPVSEPEGAGAKRKNSTVKGTLPQSVLTNVC